MAKSDSYKSSIPHPQKAQDIQDFLTDRPGYVRAQRLPDKLRKGSHVPNSSSVPYISHQVYYAARFRLIHRPQECCQNIAVDGLLRCRAIQLDSTLRIKIIGGRKLFQETNSCGRVGPQTHERKLSMATSSFPSLRETVTVCRTLRW